MATCEHFHLAFSVTAINNGNEYEILDEERL
jgi:hypothetical protein